MARKVFKINPQPPSDHQLTLLFETIRFERGAWTFEINHTDIPPIVKALQEYYNEVEKEIEARKTTT